MTRAQEWIMLAGMMLVTFGVRYPVLAFLRKLELPKTVERALSFIPVAVLTAITVPEVLKASEQAAAGIHGLSAARMAAALVAGLVAWKSRNLLATILGGMGLFLLLRGITG